MFSLPQGVTGAFLAEAHEAAVITKSKNHVNVDHMVVDRASAHDNELPLQGPKHQNIQPSGQKRQRLPSLRDAVALHLLCRSHVCYLQSGVENPNNRAIHHPPNPHRPGSLLTTTYSSKSKTSKTYNSGDSPVVTHLTTSSPVKGLSYGERTGSRAGLYLWSYVEELQTASFVSWMVTRVSASECE
jgi:hypothetical protein